MDARQFADACRRTRDSMLSVYADPQGESAVSGQLAAAGLDDAQKAQVLVAVGAALSDAFRTFLD